MQRQRISFLGYRKFRYLKMAAVLIAASLLFYGSGGGYGGTFYGYVLGMLCAVIVFVLMWYGIRKRRAPRLAERRARTRRRQILDAAMTAPSRRSSERRKLAAEEHWRFGGSMQGWLSAHVYLGVALLVLASLHSGLRFAWNLHSLTYLLLVLVVVSGLYGTYACIRFPRRFAENLREGSLEDVLLQIAELDELARNRALALPDEVNGLVTESRRNTRIGGTFLQQLIGTQADCPTDKAVQRAQELGRELVAGNQPQLMRDLYPILLQRQKLVAITRRDISLNARMQLWQYFHAPLAISLIAALMAHVATILIYW
jgi:hypothetical protein